MLSVDEEISLVFDSNLNFSETEGVTVWREAVEAHRHPKKYYIIILLINKPVDPLRKLTFFSKHNTCIDIFALVSLSKVGSRTVHEAALPQNFIFLTIPWWRRRSPSIIALIFALLQRTLSIVENRYPLSSAMIRDIYGIWYLVKRWDIFD